MKMIEHVGTVVEVEGDRAVVELETTESCGSSAACGCCAALQSGRRRLQVEKNDLEAGDTVEVTMPAASGYLSILVVFGLPLALFVVGMVIGARFEPPGGANDMATIIGGVAGLALAVVVAVFVNRRLSKGKNRMQVRRLSPGAAHGA
jgi:positive regulator of sigma E activity